MIFYLFIIAQTLVYAGLLAMIGKPDPLPLATGYLGLILMSAMFIAVGLFSSSVASLILSGSIWGQIIAAVMTFVGLFFLWLIGALSGFAGGVLHLLMRCISFYGREGFSKGIIDTRDVVYYLSLTAFFIFLSIRALESRKWR
jgi:ABC-2 type transport system permease protein